MLHSKFWDIGFATEVAKYCLDIGFKHFRLSEIVALTAQANTASQKVMDKIGLRFDEAPVIPVM
jgi:[ribosomal protein S5]-alanine N-acetyltransferase